MLFQIAAAWQSCIKNSQDIWGISTVGSALHSHCRGHRFESGMLHHKRTLILIQRLAFFLCPKSIAPQGFLHLSGCMERAFPLFFGCKWRLMLVSPYCVLLVGCMIKRLLVVELAAVLYWVHMKCSWNFEWKCVLYLVCVSKVESMTVSK